MPEMFLPGGADRTVIIGPTGSGKTIGGAWLLSKQRFDKRPWVALDFKGEIFWDLVGDPPIRPLRFGAMPGRRGLYRMRVNPWNADELEEWLKRVWIKQNIGIFVDEVSMVPQKDAFKAILRQGRSRRIPVIACTQRPVDCDREVFTESQYRMLYGIEDLHRDYPVIKGLFGNIDVKAEIQTLGEHESLWYDVKRKRVTRLTPVPSPNTIAERLRAEIPYNWFLGG